MVLRVCVFLFMCSLMSNVLNILNFWLLFICKIVNKIGNNTYL